MTFLPDFLRERPGLLFVAATLLPLVSFLVLLLEAAIWAALRPHRDTRIGGALYDFFGGDHRGRAPAYVATGAIALAFVLCLIGAMEFIHHEEDFEAQIKEKETAIEALKTEVGRAKAEEQHEAKEKLEAAEKQVADLERARAELWHAQ